MFNLDFVFKQETHHADKGLVVTTTITSGQVYKAIRLIPYQDLADTPDVKAWMAHVEGTEARKLFDAVLEKRRG